jgi:ATP-dependent DNA helicase DinG
VLPGASAFIIDEAHQAPETATRFFSVTLSARQIEDLCRDLTLECAELTGALATLRAPMADCLQQVRELKSLIAERLPDRGSWSDLVRAEGVRSALQQLDRSVHQLGGTALQIEGRSRGMDNCGRPDQGPAGLPGPV